MMPAPCRPDIPQTCVTMLRACARPGTTAASIEPAGGRRFRADERVVVPVRSPLRSLVVAVAAAIGLGEALRQLRGCKVDPAK